MSEDVENSSNVEEEQDEEFPEVREDIKVRRMSVEVVGTPGHLEVQAVVRTTVALTQESGTFFLLREP